MTFSQSIDQLFLLLWKSWKTFTRSRGWLIAQILFTLMSWGALVVFTVVLTKSFDEDIPFDRSDFDKSLVLTLNSTKNTLRWRCENGNHFTCSPEINSTMERICKQNNILIETEKLLKKQNLSVCSHEISESVRNIGIRKFDESSLQINYYSNHSCTKPTLASNQFDRFQSIPPVSRCDHGIFHVIAMEAGKFTRLAIKYLPSLNFPTVHSELRWKLINMYEMPVLLFFIQAAREISQESAASMKDYLLSMGMSRTLYFLHHFIFHFLKMWIFMIGYSAILAYAYKSISLALFVLSVLSLATLAWTSLALSIASSFSKPRTATTVAILIWYSMSLGPTLLSLFLYGHVKRTNYFSLLICLFSPHSAITYTFDARRESELRGLNLWFSEVNWAVPQGYYMLMLVFDAVFYFILAVLIDWMRSSLENPLSLKNTKATSNEEENKSLRTNHEKSESRKSADLILEGVHKVYSTGEHAVKGVDMSMHKGQVTALLGHNGAGKSTIFSMISGMIVPTRGRIEVKGNESRSDRQQLIGYCPQYNPIFPKLTVNEHLSFFALLKDSENDKGEGVLLSLGMAFAGDAKSKDLSGGMKRKLSIAIAMAADSPIILLDEPTAGMDTGARRDFERLLLEWKKDHTILLTTHYTDEAELLADRIFIMAKGKVFCSGSPQFLRKKFDTGFLLSFTVENEDDTERASNELLKVVKEYVPDAILNRRRGKQFEYKLPADNSTKFVEMFRKMESFGPYFGVQSYGLSLSKLEQVFLKVGEMTGTVDRSEEVEAALKELIQENDKRVEGQSKAMGMNVVKRFQYDLAHISSLLCNLTFLFAFVYLFTSYLSRNPSEDNGWKDLLTIPDCYRIGVHSSLSANLSMIKAKSDQFLKCSIVEETPSIEKWYKDHATSRPPILGGFSKEGGEWTIHIHPRNNLYLPTLEAIAVMANKPSLVNVKLELKTLSMRKVEKERVNEKERGRIGLLLALFFSYTMMVVRPISYLIVEKASNFLHQERLTGISRIEFLSSSILYDFLLYLLNFVIFICASLIKMSDSTKDCLLELTYLSLVGFLSGELILLILYRFFATPAMGESIIFFIFLIGAAAKDITLPKSDDIKPLMILNPMAALSGLRNSPSTTATISNLVCLLLHFLVLIVVFYLLESRFFEKYKRRNTKSQSRETTVTQPHHSNDSLVLRVNDLVKCYGSRKNPVYAVKGISFGVRSHECFGVLGVNGAGKTSTFEVLTGNALPDGGSATVSGVDCSTPATIGYCPQTDALVEDLTGRQSLVVLAAFHGYANPSKVADIVITCVGMQHHANKKSKTYSGGQRRKISVAAALLSQNSLIILDEPTAGIDPIARRDVWSVICALRESTNTAIVLTSHSMDEVEALVSNLIIMKEGLIVVEGSPQMIKNQFGEHYNFNLVIENVSSIGEVTNHVRSVFPDMSLIDSGSLRNIKYRIPRRQGDVFSEIFHHATEIAEEVKATDFSFTQATLEDAFMLAASSKPDVETAVAARSSLMGVMRSESAKDENTGTEGTTVTEGTTGGTEGGTTGGTEGGTEGGSGTG